MIPIATRLPLIWRNVAVQSIWSADDELKNSPAAPKRLT
jgi:hypothetical protein